MGGDIVSHIWKWAELNGVEMLRMARFYAFKPTRGALQVVHSSGNNHLGMQFVPLSSGEKY